MKIIPILFLGFFYSFGVAKAHPILALSPKNESAVLATDHASALAIDHATDHATALAIDHATDPQSVVGGRNPQRNPLECDACMFLANGVNQTIIHNPKVVSFVTADIEEICKVLPASVQQLCLSAAEQSVPNLLNNLGDFIATEGCSDLGICHTKYS